MLSEPGARKTELVCAAAIFVASFGVLAWNAAPGVTFHDSGEFIMAAASGGVPHPPGSPTWVILASIWVKLLGWLEPARATNLFSAVCGALTLGLGSLWVARIWRGVASDGTAIPVPALQVVFAASLMQSASFLEMCFVAEQYTLQSGLLAAFLLLAMDLREAGWKRAIALGLVWGLAVGNHLSQYVLAAAVAIAASPSLDDWKADRTAAAKTWGRTLGCVVAGLAGGLLVYGWPLLRSRGNPLLDYGNIETFERLKWALFRDQWPTRSVFDGPPGFVGAWLGSYLKNQHFLVPALMGVAAIVVIVRRQSRMLALLAAAILPYMAGVMVGYLRQDEIGLGIIEQYGVGDWHLPVYFALSVLAASLIAEAIHRYPHAKRAIALGSALGCVLLAGVAVARSSMRHFTATQEYIDAFLDPLPENAAVVVLGDNMAFTFPYERWVLKKGPGRWVGFGAVLLPQKIADADKAGGWNRESKVAYLTESVAIPDAQPLRVPILTKEQAESMPLYTEYNARIPEASKYMVMRGYLVEVLDRPTTKEEVLAAEAEWRATHQLRHPGPREHRTTRDAWVGAYRERANFLMDRGLISEAIESYEVLLEWWPADAEVWFVVGDLYEQIKSYSKAADAYQKAIQADPDLAGPRVNLGILYARSGKVAEGRRLLQEELARHPDNEAAKLNLERMK